MLGQARDLLPDQEAARILVLAGPGNNGGDAVEAASELSGCEAISLRPREGP